MSAYSSEPTSITHTLPTFPLNSHVLLKVFTLDSVVFDVSVHPSPKRPEISCPPLQATRQPPRTIFNMDLDMDQAARPISPTTANGPGFPQPPPPQRSEKSRGSLLSRVFGSVVPKYRTISIPPEVSGKFILQLPQCMTSPFRFKTQPSRDNPQPYLFHHFAVTHHHHIKLVNSGVLDRAPPESIGKARSQRIRMRKEKAEADRELLQGLEKFRFAEDVSVSDGTPLASPGLSATEVPEFEETAQSAAAAIASARERDTFLQTVANLSQGGSIKKGKPWILLGEGCGQVVQIVAIERTDRLCMRCREERLKFRKNLWNSHVERENGRDMGNDLPIFNIVETSDFSRAETTVEDGTDTTKDASSSSNNPASGDVTIKDDDMESRPKLQRSELTWRANGYYEKRPKLIYSNGKWINALPALEPQPSKEEGLH
ncbi:hypothetical protein MMC17_009970 [Xylographa soralifera]|nr:hypothetical protein [Xylographa soralifera]